MPPPSPRGPSTPLRPLPVLLCLTPTGTASKQRSTMTSAHPARPLLATQLPRLASHPKPEAQLDPTLIPSIGMRPQSPLHVVRVDLRYHSLPA